TKEWSGSPDWNLEIYEVPDIDSSTTIVDISKARQSFGEAEVEELRHHLGETYSSFIEHGCIIELNGKPVPPIRFDSWAYPPDYPPRQAKFTIEPTDGKFLDVKLSGGLILDRD